MLSSDQILPETDFAKNLFSEPEFGLNPLTSKDFFTPRATPWISFPKSSISFCYSQTMDKTLWFGKFFIKISNFFLYLFSTGLSVFRIRDMLVRIWIRGSVPRTNLRIRSCSFRQWPSRCQLHFEGTFMTFFKDKNVIKKSQNNRNHGFSYYFCLVIEGSVSVHLTNRSEWPKNWRTRNTGANAKNISTMNFK